MGGDQSDESSNDEDDSMILHHLTWTSDGEKVI